MLFAKKLDKATLGKMEHQTPGYIKQLRERKQHWFAIHTPTESTKYMIQIGVKRKTYNVGKQIQALRITCSK